MAEDDPPALPLSALLSQALVAFTIELDNEFEHRMPHRTTTGGSASRRRGPWLTSWAMWTSCLRYLTDDGVSVAALEGLARTTTNLAGLERWGYVTVEPDPADPRPRPPRSAWLVRPKPGGRKARSVWPILPTVIEERWRDRFGAGAIDELRRALVVVAGQLDPSLPDFLPIVGYGLVSRLPKRPALVPMPAAAADADAVAAATVDLPALLARPLLAIALEFESRSKVSLAIAANALRVLDEDGMLVRDLPRASGISKEAISMALGVLQKGELVALDPAPGAGRGRQARLTPLGMAARRKYQRTLDIVESGWPDRFGPDVIGELRRGLERLVGSPGRSPLLAGLEPYPDGWRASVRRPDGLPHFPTVLHRGGYPDGA